ncbi:DUF2802 domain-containing protein [Alteromonas sp. C1M14]|uniref:DUF2802 domain-containing protein n=1 Tax=Alteromonas sp. C1M14 TaxID=2841567 RepID=UPI001C09304E|nr:DUF2802 domain-containing protein [Alteromonas sp. C1M14]MBU2977988.1 DUF2802 domain-containing protein [Alteromonas sp. C1M14]
MDVSAFSLLAIATGLLAVIAVLWLYWYFQNRIKALHFHLQHHGDEAILLAEQVRTLENQIAEMQARSMVQGKHMQDLSEQFNQLENQLREVKTQDPSMRLYTRAAELVKSGADIEEVMQACDLPRAEAELLFSMHGTHQIKNP